MIENNKAVVRRFNQEVIGQGNVDSFNALMDENFINRSAPAGMDNGPQGMIWFFNEALRPAIPDLKVIIHDQVAEGDMVTTRKTISGKQTGQLLGVPATGQTISIEVIDMVRIKDGRYVEHWGITTLPELLATLAKA
ncbi:ester cyclase [Mucilaginibacter myungsuensis]|uniref:Ester cyclase n=2 Tax=Mucilaginibacter myungsuensis TaxID=649104 RepID=A0A929PWS4_9SPHI|nr:ester cyclase [Mucilaginibacter myungsuensis]